MKAIRPIHTHWKSTIWIVIQITLFCTLVHTYTATKKNRDPNRTGSSEAKNCTCAWKGIQALPCVYIRIWEHSYSVFTPDVSLVWRPEKTSLKGVLVSPLPISVMPNGCDILSIRVSCQLYYLNCVSCPIAIDALLNGISWFVSLYCHDNERDIWKKLRLSFT